MRFEDYSVDIDAECFDQDFDNVDLYGEKTEDINDDGFGSDIDLD